MIEYQLDILQNKILKNFNKNLKIIDNLLFLEGGASKIEYYKQYPITTFIETVDELCKTDKPNIWTYCEPELQQYIKSIKGNIKWLKLRLNIPYIKRKFKSIDSYKLLEKAYFLFRVEKSSNKKIDFQKTDSVYLIINAPDWEKKNKNMYIVHEFLNKDMNPLNFKQKTTQIKFFKIEVNQPKLRGEANLKDLIYKLSNEKMKTYVETMTKTYKQLFNMNNIIVDEPLKKIPITYTIEENKSLNIIKEKKINLLPYDKKLKYKDQKYMDDTLQINIPNNFTNEMLENQEILG